MAIIFTPMGETAVTLGGEINPATGVAGPFPAYNISKEDITKDAVFMGEKFSINITGTALITDTSSMLVSGDRQSKIHSIVNELLTLDGKHGILEISPYGGAANTIQFNDAYVVSLEVSEQDDTSQGVQSQNYSITFEASKLAGHISGSTYTEFLDDITENWSTAIEGSYNQNSEGGANVHKTFTISHSVSATCLPKKTGVSDIKSGWVEAKQWVDNRLSTLGNDPFVGASMKDLSYGTTQSLDLDSELPSGYSAYNLVVETSQDILSGTYNITRTWVASKFSGQTSIQFDFNDELSAEFQTVSVSINVTGYESISASTKPNTDEKSNKYTNAKQFFDDNIINNVFTWADTFYDSVNTLAGTTLRATPTSETQSHNQTDGTISYSATFDDASIDFPGAISQSVNVTFNNEDGGNEVIAVIPVISRDSGPIIQDMNTTGERTRSITLELQMDRDNRGFADKPDGLSYIESNYKPTITGAEKAYRQNKSETWAHRAGNYSISVDYTFNETPD